MKIGFVSFFYYPTHIGGMARYFKDLEKQLLRKGFEIVTITGPVDENTRKVVREENGNHVTYRLPALKTKNINSAHFGRRFYRKLFNIIKRENIDVLSAECIYRLNPSFSFSTYLACQNANIPVVSRMHGMAYSDIELLLLKHIPWNRISPVSRAIGEMIYKKGIEAKKIEVVHNGVDIEKFSPNVSNDWLRNRLGFDNEKIILSATRLILTRKGESCIESKGIDTLIKAFSIISQAFEDAKLLIAAPKPPVFQNKYENALKKIEELSALYNVKDSVIVDNFSLEQMPKVYADSDIFVLPSQMEALGSVFLEAMASEKPVIGTNVGGIPEIIQNAENGYLVEVDNPVELSKRLIWLLRDENRARELAKEARKMTENEFNIKKMTSNLIEMFENLIEKNGNKK